MLSLLPVFGVVWWMEGAQQPVARDPQPPPAPAMVSYCREHAGKSFAAPDRSFFCFDGRIDGDDAWEALFDLRQKGTFVARSGGGNIMIAMAIAERLHAKEASVVVYDYCLSSCAMYFLIAGNDTLVMRDTIVAYHAGSGTLPRCGLTLEDLSADKDFLSPRGFPAWEKPSEELLCGLMKYSAIFFEKRAVEVRRGHNEFVRFEFQSPMTKVLSRRLYQARDDTRADVAWTWHPRNYPRYFKTRITFEHYPETQAELDALAARFGLRNVILDP